ncbi:MAG: bifunctional rhamnulose-1-phosphate aldolase/short-chain dehydrogenase, partial [Alicyclobacillus sp.]|nr:bifunctional rhamnulose-1-phosphate aldolase/short-chain dehydrogenase [Alicyclobacillus sp.]
MPANLWIPHEASGLTGVDELVYRSNLLGRDRTIANWGGGNTSMKTVEKDFRGRDVSVMWVKGSGSDLADATRLHFTAIRLDDVLPLMEREAMTDEDMVAYLTACKLDPQHPRMSVETLLHAFLPFPHVDHTHPDAIVSLCCADNGREAAREVYGDGFIWIPYMLAGFALSKRIAEAVRDHPNAWVVLLEKHGLVTWGQTSEECYRQTLRAVQCAEDYIADKQRRSGRALFGGVRTPALDPERRRELAAQVLPVIRGAVSRQERMVLRYDDSEDVLAFAGSRDGRELSQVGAACPDHLIHTKVVPLFVDWDPEAEDEAALADKLRSGIEAYEAAYRAYFERNRRPGDEMMSPSPRVILVPGLGMIATGKSPLMADVSAQLYHRAIAVMAGATAIGRFVSLTEQESYGVEYWPLELYKLTLAPPEQPFSRQVAFITGGAGGIGSAVARRLAQEGASVVIADLNFERARQVADEIVQKHGFGRALAVRMDVTSEEQVRWAFREAVLAYGGVDILVNNAGLSTSSPFEDTSLDEWNLNVSVLGTGYF